MAEQTTQLLDHETDEAHSMMQQPLKRAAIRIENGRGGFGATTVINNKDGKAVEKSIKMSGGRGVDTAIKAVGVPASFIICEGIVAPGGIIANIGLHGVKADLHLEKLWDTTRLVDTVTTPML